MTPSRRALALASCALVPIAAGCGTVLGIEEWDVDPGAGGGASTQTSSTGGEGGAPSASSQTTTGGGAGEGGAGEGGALGPGTSASTGDGGAGGGCGVPDTTENCGACGRSCWGGTCTDGVCGPALLAQGVSVAGEMLAVDGDEVAWVAPGGTLWHVRKSEPGVAALVASAQGAHAMTLAETPVGKAAFLAADNRIVRQLLDGSDPLVIMNDERFMAQNIVAAAPFLYWTHDDLDTDAGVWRSSWSSPEPPSPHCNLSSLKDLSIQGATAYVVRLIATSYVLYACGPGVGATDWSAAEPDLLPRDVEADPSGWVYYSTFPNVDVGLPPQVRRKSAANLPSEIVIGDTSAQDVTRMVQGGDWLYWRSSSFALVAARKQAGAAMEVLVQPTVWTVAADAEGVYWVDAANAVWALRRDVPGG